MVTGEATGTETQTTGEQLSAPEQTTGVLDAVREEMGKTEGEPSQEAKSKTEGEVKKGPVKLPANERVQQAVKEKKEGIAAAEAKAQEAITRESQLSEEVRSLRQEIETIKQMRVTGQITGKQAEVQAKTAEDLFNDAIEGVELSEDLKPYRHDIARVAKQIAKTMLDAELAPIREQFKSEADRKMQAEIETEQNTLNGYYVETSKAYPDLFEAEPNEQGLPILKPEYDQQAMEILKDYSYPIYDRQGEQVGEGNKLLESKRGLETLMTLLNRNIEQVKIAKLENESVDRLKRSRVEGPESRRVSSEPKTIQEITRDVMKEFS